MADNGKTMFTISDLERESGTRRTTIYYYVHDGLLPAAQKTAASRAIYSREHLELLREIARLKGEGRSLQQIKTELAAHIQAAEQSDEDLVARQGAETREAILEAATRQFARRGYKRTRIADIIREVGITAPVLYGHFASKRQLFAQCIGVFTRWNTAMVEPAAEAEPDPTVREMRRVNGFFNVQALSPDYFSLARSEALHEGGDTMKGIRRFYETVAAGPLRDLAKLRATHGTSPPITDELMMYGLLGALESLTMRASFDDTYSRLDILRAHLFIYLCLQAAFTGKLDLAAEMRPYERLLRDMAEYGPPALPEVEAPERPRPRRASPRSE
jgi:AcrR family transcriptional regulator